MAKFLGSSAGLGLEGEAGAVISPDEDVTTGVTAADLDGTIVAEGGFHADTAGHYYCPICEWKTAKPASDKYPAVKAVQMHMRKMHGDDAPVDDDETTL